MTEMEMQDSPHLSAVEPDELIVYKSLSRLAIASLTLGVLSFLAIFAAAAWILPVVAVVLGVAGLRAIMREDSGLTGRRAAQCGIGLALLFGSWGITSFFTDQWLIERQSHQVANHFLELLREGKIYQAHQLHLTHYQRLSPGALWNEHYAPDTSEPLPDLGEVEGEENPTPAESLRLLIERPPVSTLLAWGAQARVHYEGSVFLLKTGDFLGQRYTVQREDDERRHEKIEITILTQRMFDENENAYYWNIERVIPRSEEQYY